MWLGRRVRDLREGDRGSRLLQRSRGGTASPSGSCRTVRCLVQSEEDVWLKQACRPDPGARGCAPSGASMQLDGPRRRGLSPCFVARNQFIHL